MGSHGYAGLRHWVLGSVTESVLHWSKMPVFVVRQNINNFINPARPEAMPRIRHILCPCNQTRAAGNALEVAVSLAARFEARLTVLRSLESGSKADDQDLTAWIQQTAAAGSLDIDPVVRRGAAAVETIGLAKERRCDMIVIAAHHQPFEQATVVGRTTELVLRHAPVPVLAVPFHQNT